MMLTLLMMMTTLQMMPLLTPDLCRGDTGDLQMHRQRHR